MKIIKISISCFVALLLFAVLVYVIHYYVLIFQARKAYVHSRSGSPGNYQFITMGITENMHEEEVNRIMAKGEVIMRHGPQETPKWKGYVNIYQFKYGPKFYNLFTRKDNYLIEETFYIYFDPLNHAKILKHAVTRTDGELSEWETINLTNKTIDIGDSRK